MVGSFTTNQAQASAMFPCQLDHARRGSKSSIATSKLPSELDSTIPPLTTHSRSSTLHTIVSNSSPCAKAAEPNMATYYQYDKNGALQSTSTADPIQNQPFGPIDVNHHLQRGDTVGAYLAQRAMIYPEYAFLMADHGDLPQHDGANDQIQQPYGYSNYSDTRHQVYEQYESYSREEDSQFGHAQMPVGMPVTPPYDGYEWFPHPDDVRHHHTLYSLLPLLDPARRFNSRYSQWLDIVEEGTGNVLYGAVSKRLLVMFLGSKIVKRHLTTQFGILQLVIPQGIFSCAAWRILISWMKRATLRQNEHEMEQFRVPHHTYSACTLAQTLEFLGLYHDAFRVDMTISENHFARPIYGAEFETMWKGLGPNNRYTRAMVRAVKNQMQLFRDGNRKFGRACKTIMELLEENVEIKTFVQGYENGGHTSSLHDRSSKSLWLKRREHDVRQEDSEAPTIAKRRGKAKVLRIVVDSKEPDMAGRGQDSGDMAAASEEKLAK